ncbi:hypothetical protein [Mycobacterium intracellulare]|nr:hypothetical protein [Mycobacterium intracellulare]
MGELTEPLVVSGKGDPPVRQVDVVEREFAYNGCAAGMFDAQRHDEAFKRFAGELFDRAHLVIGDGQEVLVYWLALQTRCWVAEDQSILLGVPEQRPQRLDQIVALVSLKRPQRRVDVGPGDLPEMLVGGGPVREKGLTEPK